jgi:type II secretory pathway pseudopilin PulG
MAALRTRLRREEGISLIEALVAAMLVVLVGLAVLAAFDTSKRASFRAEQSQVASDRAQQELEAIRRLPYAEVALTSQPGSSGDPADPRSRISGTTFALDEDGTNPAELAVDGGPLQNGGTIEGAAVDPGPTPFSSGDVSGNVYRFVVWQDDPHCGSAEVCDGAQDLKRIIVVVSLDHTAAGGTRAYTEVQSDTVDPDDTIFTDNSQPELGQQVVAEQFWLSDERCTDTGEPAHRDPITDPLTSHDVRDTRGYNCQSGTSDRPDALLTTPPLNRDATVDFATDADLEPDPPALPDDDAGIQFQVGGSNGCQFKPTGATGHQQAHIWVTKKLPSDFELTGGATLELWTRTIAGVTTPGKVCVTLFTRNEDPLGSLPPTDVRMEDLQNSGNLYYTHAVSDWPRVKWSKLRIPLLFTPRTVVSGDRIGVQVALEKSGSPSDQLEFMYDQVQYESRLEVETTTPLGS